MERQLYYIYDDKHDDVDIVGDLNGITDKVIDQLVISVKQGDKHPVFQETLVVHLDPLCSSTDSSSSKEETEVIF